MSRRRLVLAYDQMALSNGGMGDIQEQAKVKALMLLTIGNVGSCLQTGFRILGS